MTRWKQFKSPIQALIQGASGGLGLGMVRALLDDPLTSHVHATSRDPEGSVELMGLKRLEPERLTLHRVDLEQESSIAEVAEATIEPLDLIVVTAGVLHDERTGLSPEKRLREVDGERMTQSFRVNAIGPLLCLKHWHELMPRDRRAVFACLSARVGSIGDNRLGGWYGYRASKAALNQAVRTASIEIARRREQALCVALHPGTVDTALSRPFQGNVKPHKLFNVARSVDYLFEVLDQLIPSQTGLLFDWAGEQIEY